MLEQSDQAIFDLIKREEQRQQDGVELIASENYVGPAVLDKRCTFLINVKHEWTHGARDPLEQAPAGHPPRYPSSAQP